MSRYGAFLRGMNVGGHRLSNEALRAHFTTMGFAEVATFRASGNVVFAGEAADPASVRVRIETGLAELLGYAVPTYIRTSEELLRIAATQPFTPEQLSASNGKLQVALLFEAPERSNREQALGLASDGDRLSFGERELYWLPSGGLLESELDLKSLDRLLGAMTIRTKGTIEQIAAKHFTE